MKKQVNEIWEKCSFERKDSRNMTKIGFLQAIQELDMREERLLQKSTREEVSNVLIDTIHLYLQNKKWHAAVKFGLRKLGELGFAVENNAG